MADEKVSFLLDLDIAEFTEKTLSAKGSIQSLGSKENLSELLEGLASVGPLLATAGIAAFAFKKSIDLTVEGEEIRRINNQFEMLATNAGLAPEKLRKGLEEASGGIIDTTDLLKVANESIIKMGGSAEKLPQLMELARKATSVMGGDAKENFEKLTNAIANGNTKMLGHLGLRVDAIKAEKDFAEANGKTADELSQAGKQQAILNAVLEAGEVRFKGINSNAESATTILKTLKVTVTDLGETFTLAFEKTIGPSVRRFLGGVQEMATKLKLTLAANIGEGAEQASAKLEINKLKVKELEKQIDALGRVSNQAFKMGPTYQNEMKRLTEELSKYKGELGKVEAQNQAMEKSSEADEKKRAEALKARSAAEAFDKEKSAKQFLAFSKEKEKIDSQYFLAQQKNVKTLEQVDKAVKQQALVALRQHQLALAAIENNANISRSQKGQLRVSENKRFQEEMVQAEDSAWKLKEKLLDNYVHNSKTAFGGIEAAFKANTQKMIQEQADMGKRGTEIWNSLQANAVSSFEGMGTAMAAGKDVASATADAMRGFFLGMLADRAKAEGSLMLAASVWPPNPIGIAGGIGLLALAGVLKAAAGPSAASNSNISTSASPTTTASGAGPRIAPISSGGNTGGASADAQSTAMPNMAQNQQQQKVVSVNIAGNYLETDATKRMLMDLMRQESDATGFNYNQIGA